MYLAVVICMILLSLNSIQCTNHTTPDVLDDVTEIYWELKDDRTWSEEIIIDLLVARSNDRIQEIKKMYKNLYKKDLVNDLDQFFFTDTKEALLALMVSSHLFYAYQLHKAVDGLGTDENAISQILGSMTNAEILNVSAIYKNEYGVSLKEDLIGDTSGSFMDLVVSLCNAERNESNEIDFLTATTDAKFLDKACGYSAGNDDADEAIVTSILTTRSRQQLAFTFNEFSKISFYSITHALKKKFKGDTLYGYLILVKFAIYSTAQFYAIQLEESMKGFGTDDGQLTRIILGRSDIDLNEIKVEYKEMYGMELADRVTEDTMGNYRRLLLSILNRKL